MSSKLIASIFSIALSLSAFANGPVTVSESATSGTYNLTYRGSETGKVVVTILNATNQVVFTEVIRNANSFVRPYNFSNLTDGEYSIKVSDSNGTHIEKVTYSRSNTFIRVRPLANETQKFLVTVINNKPQRVVVRIYENQKGLIYEGNLDVNGTQSTIYNLSNLNIDSEGIIFFEVATEGKVETAIF